MLPSLVAAELRSSLTSFLGTTFALADDDVRAELERFVGNAEDGVFRGPFVRLRLPFRPAAPGWRDLLGFVPDGFTPHRHQAQAWERLSSLQGVPRPTLVTTGSGSGKTESFLVPLLDHCARTARTRGIKAIVLYPMNALANDQARRAAAMVHAHAESLGGVRVGLYTGDSGGSTIMTETSVIGDRHALRADPPDILLTNYKMLDMLLLRAEDKALFEGASQSLRYLVLDEFHTYDGAQGTDVAMLLRRLGMALGTRGVDGPLTGITPVATSATLGSGGDSGPALRTFAQTVFGVPFERDALVVEDRLTPAEWATSPTGSVPLLEQVTSALAGCTSHAEVVEAAALLFLGTGSTDRTALGEALRAHPLTRRLVELAGSPVALAGLVEDLEPAWVSRPEEAQRAVSAYLALLSEARVDGGDRPLLSVDVQLWLREVRRVLRRLDVAPGFRWHEGTNQGDDVQLLAALFCRHCGRSGWGTAAKAAGGYTAEPDAVWRTWVTDRRSTRAWIFAPGEGQAGDPRVQWVDGATAELGRTPSGRHSTEIPVLVTLDEDDARTQRCPSCGLVDGIRFLGSSVATLASAALGHVFASPDVETAQKKTLVFTDSVQDASHRASFIESRASVLNRRSLLLRAVPPGGCTLDEIGSAVVEAATTSAERYAVLPPDLKVHETFQQYWQQDEPDGRTRAAVTRLLDFTAAVEFGLSARVGRTLELTGAATAHVHAPELADAVRDVTEALGREAVQLTLDVTRAPRLGEQLTLDAADEAAVTRWARGVLERIRLQGGVLHPWFTRYISSGADRHSIWGGRPRREGMPAFPSGRPAPAYPSTVGADGAFDPIHATKGWYAQWTARALGVPSVDSPRYVRTLLDAFTAAGVLDAVTVGTSATAWALAPNRVMVQHTSGDAPPTLRCTICSTVLPAPAEVIAELVDAPCLRLACPGTYDVTTLEVDYYRDLYRAGQVRRIVAQEHTSLLPPEERVQLEERFKAREQDSNDPNLLTCTPTLELGIDIGDLTMVALTSMPRSTASYLQRVGRAGRLTGSSLVLSMLPARPLELQRLADPLSMIAGDVVPPACYLDAVEILRRQYLASLVDRRARSGGGATSTRRAADVLTAGLDAGSWLGTLVADARTHAATYVGEFLDGFGDEIAKETRRDLEIWVGVDTGGEVPGIERAVEQACATWTAETAELDARRKKLQHEVERLEALPSTDDEQERDRKRVRGELRATSRTLSERRSAYWISALEDLGLLPAYALVDDSTQLDVGLWWTDEETGAAERSDNTYQRGSRTALSELAPGATFYVRGTAVEIDGLDLGTTRNPNTERRRLCPSCGWSGPASETVTACPRCADPAAADAGQVLLTLPFRKASAYASRELAMRDDDGDDRRRTQFTVTATVDADPANIDTAWGLESFQFGAEVLRRADIRWTNLGPSTKHGATLRLAGEDHPAGMFEACTSCGVVWAAQRGVHGAADARHRGWCSQRKTPRADGWTTVVLTHQLRTQAVRLLVPPVVIVDPTLLTSFRAALLLGLRQVLGGDPDHIDVITAVDPSPGADERWAMVLHDTVPGGTGYLTRFGQPEEVQRLLQAAQDFLVTCPCNHQDLAACHRCLLPHVPPHLAPLTRRDRAVELLTDILADWVPRTIESLRSITVQAHDTPIERRFRHLVLRWARTRGATVSSFSTSYGDRAEIQLPPAAGGLRWRLTPQVDHGFVRPDFDLVTDDPDIPTITVFCDGAQFHVSPEHNRVADDAVKRHELREQGHLVWAVTHWDLDVFETVLDGATPTAPAWAAPGVAARAVDFGRSLCKAGHVPPDRLLADPLSVLVSLLVTPNPDRWSAAATCVALALADANKAGYVATTTEAIPALVRADVVGAALPAPAGTRTLLLGRTAGGASVGLDLVSQNTVHAVLAVDDRADVVGTPEHRAAWRDWLALGNALQLLDPGTLLAATPEQLPSATDTAATVSISPQWRAIVSAFDGTIAELAQHLAEAGTAVPEAGYEVADGEHVLDLAWTTQQVTVVVGEDTERDGWLAEHGWTVVPAETEKVRAALGPQETEPG